MWGGTRQANMMRCLLKIWLWHSRIKLALTQITRLGKTESNVIRPEKNPGKKRLKLWRGYVENSSYRVLIDRLGQLNSSDTQTKVQNNSLHGFKQSLAVVLKRHDELELGASRFHPCWRGTDKNTVTNWIPQLKATFNISADSPCEQKWALNVVLMSRPTRV